MPPAEKSREPKLKKKPGRRPTSCAECRRLKLKCDRQVPCEKCVSRGCAQICPDGCLEPSRGNKMVLSGTQELHDRIEDLCVRIHELEDALRVLHDQHSEEPHPLLRTDVLRPRSQLDTEPSPKPLSTERTDYSSDDSPMTSPDIVPEPKAPTPLANIDDTDSFGTLAVHDGASKYMGKTARSELLMDLNCYSRDYRDLYADRNASSRESLFGSLPLMSQATHLCNTYLKNSNVLYAPLSYTELFDDILHPVYAIRHSSSSFHTYHATALLFATFAVACYFDDQRAEVGHEYYQLARMALNLAPPARYTTLVSIQTMITLAQYLDLTDWDNAGLTSAWLDIGQAVRLGFSIGLHLNSARWQLPVHDVEKRKRVFWQLFVADTWSSFYLGRPSSMRSSYIESPLPSLDSAQDGLDGSQTSTFQLWFYGYTKLLDSVMANGMTSTPPSYPDILVLDRRVREHTVPSVWKVDPNSSPVSEDIYFYRWFVLASKETTLMNLHRPYFAQALCEQLGDKSLREHRYIASIVAIYRSSWRIISTLELTWLLAPDTIRRTNLPWSQALSAMIVLTLLITRAPTSHLVAPALKVLHGLQELFLRASHTCRSAHTLLPSIQRLYNKACQSVNPPQYQPSASPSEASITQEELDRLGGKTQLITRSTPMYFPVNSNDSTRSSSSRSSRAGNAPVTHAPGIKLESLHPVLAQDLKDYGRGQQPSQSYTDGSRNTSPTPSLTTTVSSGRGSSHGSSSYPRAQPPPQPSQAIPGRQAGGYYPSPPPHREGYGTSQSGPPPAYNHQQGQQQQQHYSDQGHHAQRPAQSQQPHPATRYNAGHGPYPVGKFSSLSPPCMPGVDPTIDMLDGSWQTVVEQLGW